MPTLSYFITFITNVAAAVIIAPIIAPIKVLLIHF